MANTITSMASLTMNSKVQVEGIQSVMSLRPTEPRHTRKVILKHPQTMGIFQKCHHILLYYKKASDEDSGWVVAGRLKESIGRALLDYPMISGRLRWCTNGGDHCSGERELELVSNDSGIRLVEAKFGLSLDEFLLTKERELAEGELVFWEELNEKDPQFCPLGYIQVTNFQCGGYSIGFSLSIVLGDPLELTSFIEHIAKLHNDMFQETKTPVFYLPKLKTHKSFSVPTSITHTKHSGQILLYNVNNVENLHKIDNTTVLKQLALDCIKEAEQKLDISLDLDFALFVKGLKMDDLTVEAASKEGLASPVVSLTSHKLMDIAFWETHKPTEVAYWIGLREHEGLVMVSSSSGDGNSGTVDIIINIPHRK